jgi:hypothetical protein
MSLTMLIIIIAVATAVITALAASRRGPHVTEITRTVRKEQGGEDA